jgi:ArsR family transcriptional regulator
MRSIAVIDETCCPRVLAAPLGEEEAERLASALGVLADPTRLRLLSLIGSQPEGVCVCDLTEPVGLSQPTVSHHLKVLMDAGLLDREQRGRWAFYRLDPDRLAFVRDALSV